MPSAASHDAGAGMVWCVGPATCRERYAPQRRWAVGGRGRTPCLQRTGVLSTLPAEGMEGMGQRTAHGVDERGAPLLSSSSSKREGLERRHGRTAAQAVPRRGMRERVMGALGGALSGEGWREQVTAPDDACRVSSAALCAVGRSHSVISVCAYYHSCIASWRPPPDGDA